MKRRYFVSNAAYLVMALLSLTMTSSALAQGLLVPQPYPPTPTALLMGRFYVQAGVKYRNLDTLRVNIHGGPSTLTAVAGTIPFGPTTAGPFGIGTGRLGFVGEQPPPAPLPPAIPPLPPSGPVRWNYDNGFIDSDVSPNGLGGPNCVDPVLGPLNCSAVDLSWGYSAEYPEIGRYVVTLGGPGCCAGVTVPRSIGSFGIIDPTAQTDNGGGVVGLTTRVSYTLLIPDSIAFIVDATPAQDRELGANIWSPNIEFGFQANNFFDVFYGSSWFNVNRSTGVSRVLNGTGARTVIRDTFPFYSDDDSTWPASRFNSGNTVINATGTNNYRLSTNNSMRGVFPTREFLSAPDFGVPLENIQESVSLTSNINVWENRFGARSWVPLFGFGRFGASAGAVVDAVNMDVSGIRSYTALGPTTPGQVLYYTNSRYKEWVPNYGVFFGTDVSLAVGWRSAYVNAGIDYAWMQKNNATLDAVGVDFSPGGMSVGLSGGLYF